MIHGTSNSRLLDVISVNVSQSPPGQETPTKSPPVASSIDWTIVILFLLVGVLGGRFK
jgi:hypothetical protein